MWCICLFGGKRSRSAARGRQGGRRALGGGQGRGLKSDRLGNGGGKRRGSGEVSKIRGRICRYGEGGKGVGGGLVEARFDGGTSQLLAKCRLPLLLGINDVKERGHLVRLQL